MTRRYVAVFLLALLLCSCGTIDAKKKEKKAAPVVNPPAEDPEATVADAGVTTDAPNIADSVETATEPDSVESVAAPKSTKSVKAKAVPEDVEAAADPKEVKAEEGISTGESEGEKSETGTVEKIKEAVLPKAKLLPGKAAKAADPEPVVEKAEEAVEPEPEDFDELDEDLDDEDMMDDFGPTTADLTIGNVTSGASPAGTEVKAMETKTVLPDDISPSGNCSADITTHCADVKAGKAAVLDCLAKRVKTDKAGNEDKGTPVSDGCKADIRAFKIEMYKDITMDTKLQTACADDAKKFCDDDFLYPEPGNILACLREANQVDTLNDACKAEIFRAQEEAANDFALDPQLNELCGPEAAKLCKGVQPGEGRTQDCLREHRAKLGWDCQAELFRQEVENVVDIRLNVRLFRACLNDKKKFCNDVAPGDARVKDCLEMHHLDPDFSPSCKEEFEKMMERRATDFRLDPTLRKFCKADIGETCYPDAEDIAEVANWDAKVIQCLQDFRDELKEPKCRQQVRQLTKRAAEDIRFDKPLADACHADRTSICKDVPDGMAQVFRCLQDNRDKLKEVCRSALFEQEVRMAEDIDFKFPMRQACSAEKTRFCPDVTQGHASVIKCLVEHQKDPDMGAECAKEIQRDQLRSAEDYRLNYRLNKACFNDVKRMCLNACQGAVDSGSVTCGGQVLKCLSEKKEKIESPACKKEVFSFEKQEVTDIRLDIPLQTACKSDLETKCKKVPMDHQRTLACLRKNRDNLTTDCKEEELRFSIMEASDIRLTPTLMNACGQELHTFCKDVPPTEGQAFKCLQSYLEEVGMGAACKGEVNLQEVRHAANYRLDVRLRNECEEDVQSLCAGVDEGQEGHALVLKCFVNKYKKLSASCATEVSYAVRMALWQYAKGADLTQACDPVLESPAVQLSCPTVADAQPINGAVIAVYGQCLLQQKLKDLPKECKKLVKVVLKNSAHVGGKIDEGKLQETIDKLTAAAAAAGGAVPGAESGFVLSGWFALLGMASLFLVLVGGAASIYYNKFDPRRNYTMVVKAGDV
eukprot:TRINITY_DN2493_c0_g1_i1.p1 TRINITY_DN2493_c0_g1~~TRINITY_DN2493_c0_g1_i1.p1  ORF type:complete len:1041 (-),score=222.27 TRINITY_DN2493_c0_g1_i1:278-3400(-)